MMMYFDGIDTSGYSDLEFSGYFAEDDDGTNQDWDDLDHVRVDYQIDGGGYQPLFWIQNDGRQFNSAPFIDTDFDGVGDGAEITDEFTSPGPAAAWTFGSRSCSMRATRTSPSTTSPSRAWYPNRRAWA